MTLEMIGTQSIHPDYSNLHNILLNCDTGTSLTRGPSLVRVLDC